MVCCMDSLNVLFLAAFQNSAARNSRLLDLQLPLNLSAFSIFLYV